MRAMKVADVRVGARHRKDLGDVDALVRSITEIGLLHPIVVTSDGVLIAGQRRLEACRRLGWSEIPCRVVDLDNITRAESDENRVRKDFTPSESVAIAETLEAREREAAAERQVESRSNRGENFTPRNDAGKALDHVASAVGMSRPTLAKARAVVESARQEPERFGGLLDQMDSTGKVDRAFKELQRERLREQNRVLVQTVQPITQVATQRYSTIVIDPPWDWGDEGDCDQYGRAKPTYSTMSIDEIAALPIPELANNNGHLYLWITNRSLPKGFALLERWGFRYVTMLTWVKPSFGMGNYFRGSTEHVLFGVKGSLGLLRSDVGTHFAADRPGPHSGKPDAFYALVESCSPGPWLEMFSRKQRAGWVAWGAEAA